MTMIPIYMDHTVLNALQGMHKLDLLLMQISVYVRKEGIIVPNFRQKGISDIAIFVLQIKWIYLEVPLKIILIV